MTDQELLDMFIQERFNMLIDIIYKNQPDKPEQEEKRFYMLKILLKICLKRRNSWLKIILTLF